MWIYSAASQADYAGLFYSRGTNVVGLDFLGTTNKLTRTWDGTDFAYDSGLVVQQNVWSMVGMAVGPTSTKFWLNTSSNVRTFSSSTQTWDAINIGRDSLSNSRCFNGRISQVLFYNQTLTDAAVTRNFEALRGRYGI